MRSFSRRTLAERVTFEGRGLHSGEPVTVVVSPGHSGITFNSVHAVPGNVVDTSRCTRLKDVSTIEHLMSAFAGLGVTDADVTVSASEMPAMDGSSRTFFSVMSGVGLTDIGEGAVAISFDKIEHSENGASVCIKPGSGLFRYEFECGEKWPHSQHFDLSFDTVTYEREIAPARTFAFEDEMEMVRAAGLGQGLDETTAFVIGESGYVNQVLFEDEPVRHKILDLIGDLYLAGVPLQFLDVTAMRSGHKANVAVAQKLRESVTFTF